MDRNPDRPPPSDQLAEFERAAPKSRRTPEQADASGRLARVRALLAQDENLHRPSEEVLRDIADIIGKPHLSQTYQKPLG